MPGHRTGFTLLEVLLASGLAAVISAAVLVPMVYTLSALEKTQYEFSRESDSDSAAAGIFRELRASSPEADFPAVEIKRMSGNGVEEDGMLTVWTSSISKEGHAAGAVCYRIISGDTGSGLYRTTVKKAGGAAWSDDTGSGPQTPDKKDGKHGRPVIRNIEGIAFEARAGGRWVSEYSGKIPEAFRISVSAGGKRRVYEEILPLSH